MSEAASPEVFRVLIDRTGLTLTPQQFDELRGVHPKLAAMAERLKRPMSPAVDPVAAEPAAVFSPAAFFKG